MSEKMDIALKKCTTPKFRVSFPNVFKAKSFKDQEAKFSITMLFDKKTDISELRRAARNAIVEKFGEDKTKWPKKLRMPFRDGDEEKEGVTGYENVIFVGASSKTRPGVIDREKAPITEEDDAFYAGCYARATLIAFYYDNTGNKGVSFALQNLQKLGDGEKFSGKRDAAEEFDDLESEDAESGSDDDSGDDAGF